VAGHGQNWTVIPGGSKGFEKLLFAELGKSHDDHGERREPFQGCRRGISKPPVASQQTGKTRRRRGFDQPSVGERVPTAGLGCDPFDAEFFEERREPLRHVDIKQPHVAHRGTAMQLS
jgi:hypothetical protein